MADGIPTTVICDNMAASIMRQGRIQAVVVGAERIAPMATRPTRSAPTTLPFLQKSTASRFMWLRRVDDRSATQRARRFLSRSARLSRSPITAQAAHSAPCGHLQPGLRCDAGKIYSRHLHRARGVARSLYGSTERDGVGKLEGLSKRASFATAWGKAKQAAFTLRP